MVIDPVDPKQLHVRIGQPIKKYRAAKPTSAPPSGRCGCGAGPRRVGRSSSSTRLHRGRT